MPKIRVLVIEDSVVMRRMISDALSSDPGIEVAGAAANGKIGIQKISQTNPDVITLDMDMPEMDGIATLKAIRSSYPKLPVIIFSTLTDRGTKDTLTALSLGADDYVVKPTASGPSPQHAAQVRAELLEKVKALGLSTLEPAPRPLTHSSPSQLKARTELRVVAIGTSTGGPNALDVILPSLPADVGVPILIVQHMPPLFTQLLAERLNTRTQLRVVEASDGMELLANHVYIAPGDHHMVVEPHAGAARIRTHQAPPENSCRPAVDVLFRSVATVYGPSALAVVLTGMGKDGLRGCERIHERGGRILAQDKDSCVVWGMPRFIEEAGLAEEIIPIEQMAAAIERRVRSPHPHAAYTSAKLPGPGGLQR